MYQFPDKDHKNPSTVMNLYSLKMGEFYRLVSSIDEVGKCVAYDSYLDIVQANKDVFVKKTKDEFKQDSESDDDEVKKGFEKKEYVPVVVVSSVRNKKQVMFPLKKSRGDAKKITGMSLITNPKNTLELEVDED